MQSKLYWTIFIVLGYSEVVIIAILTTLDAIYNEYLFMYRFETCTQGINLKNINCTSFLYLHRMILKQFQNQSFMEVINRKMSKWSDFIQISYYWRNEKNLRPNINIWNDLHLRNGFVSVIWQYWCIVHCFKMWLVERDIQFG